jgi:hypothetical protein
VRFLRPRPDGTKAKFTSIKKVLMEPQKVEEAIVAAYIKKLSASDQQSFRSLINIFMGALIEDFISSVSEVGAIGKGRPVDVFYDTSVLLT